MICNCKINWELIIYSGIRSSFTFWKVFFLFNLRVFIIMQIKFNPLTYFGGSLNPFQKEISNSSKCSHKQLELTVLKSRWSSFSTAILHEENVQFGYPNLCLLRVSPCCQRLNNKFKQSLKKKEKSRYHNEKIIAGHWGKRRSKKVLQLRQETLIKINECEEVYSPSFIFIKMYWRVISK